ncbi:hypothetical protein FAZ78_21430 [Cereibacter changlensis]|jgi:hypothetical protein|uniref:Uncharacterized protein n=1 Tax=Cereibacter changlensis TaxID=402884 RepID=A0A4U0YST3_9RHOB|nr:hypothetical protein [Cereibacter changlensis]TKA94608.1 hypothetical protein FAZ78_21430 [Cereibacter changlensis]
MNAKRPLFLARRSYRRRRLRDVARMLPVFGAFLFLLPVLWAPGLTERRDTAPDGIYLFAAWFFLVLAAAALAPGLEAEVGADAAEDDDR